MRGLSDYDAGYMTGKNKPENGFHYNPYLISGPVEQSMDWWRGFDAGRRQWRREHPDKINQLSSRWPC